MECGFAAAFDRLGYELLRANMWSSTDLYTSPGASSLSKTNDTIRNLHKTQNPSSIISLFDDDSASTSLCCVRPCRPLLETILKHCGVTDSDNYPGTILLSIGSASGLLEYLLQFVAGSKLLIYGIDVANINVFLDSDRFVLIRSETPEISAVPDATILFASYLRRPALLPIYLEVCPHITRVILVGPISEDPFSDESVIASMAGWRQVYGGAVGLRPWEQMKVFVRAE
ncbi:uncharacterized protein SPPG_02577 [Spizellomyces punctatus DAOM BR117]|uniref:Uncharacterized protein n=1 Tax=Spizellomyces punctatus (strain DAOM BR117) TaxID=645134 RepID=A0A0L0HMR2_SPIPD|nr:uncharacterized protein SPPG_02577 [Spizellomyces punctatus DAOM BR117]KND02074.1 hypothetical protein SPPG_02577 [Spizellomyces punctatus DAOM BR117]|eukprot:XP_016610113.1 hypothetical protein SPPG_02577 [Spizellomyces punctatus DAOM BR117]